MCRLLLTNNSEDRGAMMTPEVLSKIPPHGAYFLCRPKFSDPVSYQRTTLYKISRDQGLHLKAMAHLKTSVTVPDFLQEFEPDPQWFGQRRIEVITEEEAKEMIAREASYDKLLANCSGSFLPTAYLKNDELANLRFEVDYVLFVTKLIEPIELAVAGQTRWIKHVSNSGDLIYGVNGDSIDSLSYLKVPSKDLAAFVNRAIKVGFCRDIEKSLKQHGKNFSPKLRNGPDKDWL
jgi:hypothetical protein